MVNLLRCFTTKDKSKPQKESAEDKKCFGQPVTKELNELMKVVWRPHVYLGDVIKVILIEKPSASASLGMAVQGFTTPTTQGGRKGDVQCIRLAASELVDSDVARDRPARHFVAWLVENTTLAKLPKNTLCCGDELLQVNGYRLQGMSYAYVMQLLRSMPKYVQLVVARQNRHDENVHTETGLPVSKEALCLLKGLAPPMTPGCLEVDVQPDCIMFQAPPQWSSISTPFVIQMKLTTKQIGFSFAQYESMNAVSSDDVDWPGRVVYTIEAFVKQPTSTPQPSVFLVSHISSSSSAHADCGSRICVGDRLLSVNGVDLTALSQDEAVAAFKRYVRLDVNICLELQKLLPRGPVKSFRV